MSTALNRLLGTTQGRIAPVGARPPSGTYVFVLGSDVPGQRYRFLNGDKVTVEQTADATGQKLLRFWATIRGPETMPGDAKWTLEWGVGVDVHGSRVVEPGRTTLINEDSVVNLTSLAGDHTVFFRLVFSSSFVPAGASTVAEECELPGVYLDAMVLDSAPAALVVTSRRPEPLEEAVPKGTNIELLLVSTTAGPTISVPSTQVYVGGVLAFSAGVFQAGFDGPGSVAGAVTGPSAMYRIVIDPTTDFVSEAVVDVRVVSLTSIGGALDATYSFTIQDLTAPRVVSATAPTHTTVRVVFDEAMMRSDAAATSDALHAANYVLTPLDAPAVTPLVTSVREVTSTVFELTLNTRASFGRRYRLTVVDAEDDVGNVVEVPFNTADFTAPECAKPANRDFDLFRMLPEMNRREDNGDLLKFTLCLQEVVDLILCETDRFADFLDPDSTTIEGVRAMLADLGNPFTFDLSEAEERKLVRLLVPLYKQKGTDPGIRNAVRLFLGFDVTLTPYLGEGLSLGESELGVDWVLGPSTSFMKYAFDVNVALGLTEEQRKRLISIVVYMKPSHTHLVSVVEPVIPGSVDHLELGMSELGDNWELH